MSKENEQNTPVKFTTTDPANMKFYAEYRCARSSAGQVVVGLRWLATSVSNDKTATNEYQEKLYPRIVQLANEVYDEYK